MIACLYVLSFVIETRPILSLKKEKQCQFVKRAFVRVRTPKCHITNYNN